MKRNAEIGFFTKPSFLFVVLLDKEVIKKFPKYFAAAKRCRIDPHIDFTNFGSSAIELAI